jgi:hypothetical protein
MQKSLSIKNNSINNKQMKSKNNESKFSAIQNHEQLIQEMQTMNLDDELNDEKIELNKNLSNYSNKKPKVRNEIQEFLEKDCDNF